MGRSVTQDLRRYVEVNLMSEYPICIRCDQPVKVSKDQYELFERMHWLYFHLELSTVIMTQMNLVMTQDVHGIGYLVWRRG